MVLQIVAKLLDFAGLHEGGKVRFCLFVTLCLIGMFSSPEAAWSLPLHTQEELQRLASGEVIVWQDPSDNGGKRRVHAAVLIDTTAAKIWGILMDCEHTPEFVPGLLNCRYVQRGKDSDVLEQKLKRSWLLPVATYRFRARYEQFRRIDFTRISGDMREFVGSWVLEPADDGRRTLVEYSIYLDPGFLAPQWLVRKMLRKDLTELVSALRDRAAALTLN